MQYRRAGRRIPGRCNWLAVAIGILAPIVTVTAQGCMPLRFTSASLGGQQIPYLLAHDWQVGVAARRVATHRFFNGSHEDESFAPGGAPLYITLNTVDLGATWAGSDRFSLSVTVPLSRNTTSNVYPDLQRHLAGSTGIGDISVIGNYWLGTPATHPTGNVLVGFGVKAPTGSYHALGDAYEVQGSVVRDPEPATVQLGDGGWYLLMQGQGFRRLLPRVSAYAAGFYSVSLRKHTDVFWAPANAYWAVPDVYTARLGVSYAVSTEPALSVGVGGRVDGTMVRDLIGGRTDYFRHAGDTWYVEPGVTWQSGRNQFTLNVPVRVKHRYLDMRVNDGQDIRPGLGGVGDFVVYAGYARRM